MGPRPCARPCARAKSRAVAVCAALVALVAGVLWPDRAFAAILPACENDFVSQGPALAPEDDPEACEPVGARGDDIDNSRAAPICDADGASAVAPPRMRGLPDIRLERRSPCDTGFELHAAVSPSRGDPPVTGPETLIERGVLPCPEGIGPAAEVTLIVPPARTDGPREGFRDGVFHPPRQARPLAAGAHPSPFEHV